MSPALIQRRLGNIVLDRIIETESADPFFDPLEFFPETTPAHWERHKSWMQPRAMDPASGKLVLAIQSFLVRTRHHTIVVDTCVGDHKSRSMPRWNMTSSGQWLANLAAAGVRPEAVDYVMCTHLHRDHVGWNTVLRDGRWVPTFPNATYVFSQKEYDYWATQPDARPNEGFPDSVRPVVEAGRAALVANDFALDDEVWLEPTPGHTPDHMSVHLKSNGAQGVITGDLIHTPVQCLEPTWAMRADFDRDLARKTRRAFLERYCGTDVLVCATHFPSPSWGRVVPRGDAFWFEFEGD
jgi:glyoxylase-like metal-dependent hydrolase (beta-lactamase superfamily II)